MPSYWVVDPEEPSLTVFEVDGDAYREVARVVGRDGWDARRPYPVRVVPTQLVE